MSAGGEKLASERAAGVTWGCTTVTFGGSLTEKLEAMAAAGFKATEMWPRDLFENAEGPEFAVRALRDAGLGVSVYQALRDYEGMGAERRRRKLGIARQLMDQMDLIGVETLVLCSNCAADCSSDAAEIVDDLGALADLAAECGKRIAFEVLAWGRWINDYRDGADLVRKVDHPAFGLMLDSFHYLVKDVPLSFLESIDLKKIFHVEISDLPKTRLPVIDVSRNYRLFPGEGMFPAEDFVRKLIALGYAGITTIEIFNAAYRAQPPLAVAARAMASAENIFRAAR